MFSNHCLFTAKWALVLQTCVPSCGSAVSDIWGAGWGQQEGLGVVIKLPLFPPGSLQGSDSALIGQQVTRQPGDSVCPVTPGDRREHGSFIIFNL